MSERFDEVDPAMLDLASDAARHACRLGADFADVLITRGSHLSVAIEGNDIQVSEQHEQWHSSVRAFIRGGMGLSGRDGAVVPERLHKVAAEAVDLARQVSPNPDFVDLPQPADPLVPESALALYDPSIARLSLADAVRLARDTIDRAMDVDGEVLLNGEVSFSAGWGLLASSTGIAATSSGTFGDLSLFAVARDADSVGSFTEFTAGRHWADLDIEPLAEKTVRGARMLQHARPCPTRTMTLVLGPLAVYGLLTSLAGGASAEAIRRRRSVLTGRLGRPIAAPLLTLEDRPLEVRGLHSGVLDGEGAPRRPVVIIDRGVFAEALTNHFNARLAGLPNNGHGTRQGFVASTNLQARPGDQSEAELLADVADGVYLHAGSLDPQPTSGDISTVLDFASRIEHGRLTCPLAGAMVAGNLLDLLGRIDGVSSDFRREPGFVLPTIRIRDVQIIGDG